MSDPGVRETDGTAGGYPGSLTPPLLSITHCDWRHKTPPRAVAGTCTDPRQVAATRTVSARATSLRTVAIGALPASQPEDSRGATSVRGW